MARLVSKDCVIDIELRDEIVTLGRSSTNAICLRAPGISKVHAKIEPCPEGFRLFDLDSTNGTFVNGVPIKEALLRNGDFVKFGSEVLLFLADGKDLTPTQIYEIFESAQRPQLAPAEDDEFLWGPEQEDHRGAAATLAEEAPAPSTWSPPWKQTPSTEAERSEEGVEIQIGPGEVALLGEVRREEDFRGELLRMEEQLRTQRFLVTALWITASALLHFQIILVLGNIALLGTEARVRRIVPLETRFVEALERESVPPIPLKPADVPPVPPSAAPEEAAVEKMATATKDLTPLPPVDLKTIEVEGLLGPPRPRAVVLGPSIVAAQPGTGKALALVTSEKPQTQAEILDDLVREMVEALRKDFLHVILIFDESRSIDKDREWIRNRLEGIIKELHLHLKERELARLRWSVASFGRMPRLHQSPTDKVDDVRKAIARVPNDDSGIENTCAALQFCMRHLRTRFNTFLILVTDERGNDTDNDRILEETISELKRLKFRVFVFGREAHFSLPVIREPYRDPKSGQMIPVETDAGPESAMPEFFSPDPIFDRTDVMPSGFGIYAQARIADQTKGRYYFLNPGPQVYDPTRMEQYTPDLCSRKEYAERRARSAARNKVLTIVQEWDKVRPEARVQTSNVMTMVPFYMTKVDKAMSFCSEGIAALKALQFPKSLELKNLRWEAHRDLVLAELYKFKFMLEEYKAGLKGLQGAPLTRNGGPLNGFEARLLPGGSRGSTPAAKKLHESALAQFKTVMEKHAQTPWAAVAANEMKTMGAVMVIPTYAPSAEERREQERRQPPQRPPEPPKV